MNARAQTQQPPVHVPAVPTQDAVCRVMNRAENGASQISASLSAVPAIQRKCTSCEAEEKKLPVQPRLAVGPANDAFEVEADNIATQVMAQEQPGHVSPSSYQVQRSCTNCSNQIDDLVQRATDGKEDEVRMRAHSAAGGESISASSAQLTSGGSPLPSRAQHFFENRMGHDLSDVRVHQGSEADSLNRSIGARAFTYKNHIWLSQTERAEPSFTMAHEMAHVLQQTRPGPVGADAPMVRRAPSSIVSPTIYFTPKKKEHFTQAHDLAVNHAISQKADLMGEVRVPNANKKGATYPSKPITKGKGFGFADIVKSKGQRLWGLGFHKARSVQTPAPWYMVDHTSQLEPVGLDYFGKRKLSVGSNKLSDQAATQYYKNNAAPYWGATDFTRSAANAPGKYEIGDMKFAGDLSRNRDATSQVGHYVNGFNFAAGKYNEMVAQSDAVKAGSNSVNRTGSSSIAPLSKTSFSAAAMNTEEGSTSFVPITGDQTLIAARYGHDVFGNAKWERVPTFEVTGKTYYRQNPNSKLLWEYVFWPNEIKALDDKTARDDRRSKLTGASKELYDQMVASPAGKKMVMPQRVQATPSSARVRRKGQKKPNPPASDPFARTYPKWQADQKTFTKTFSGYADPDKGTGKDQIAKLVFDTALQNTSDLLNKTVPGGKSLTLDGNKLTQEQKAFRQAELIEGKSGRILGAMRKTMGTTFIKAVNIYQRLKTKFEEFLANRRTGRGGKSGKLGKAIFKVAGVIFGHVFKVLLPQIGAYLVECLEEGFKSLMQGMFEFDFSQLRDEQIDGFIEAYKDVEAKIEEAVEKAAGKIKDRFGEIYEKVMDAWEVAGTLITIARHAFNVARAVACAAGGLETIGVACVVAGVDYLLSLIGESPSEALLAHLLESCEAQDLIAQFILGRAIIRNLPQELAETIRAYVKDLLPTEVQPILCDSISSVPPLPEAKEIPCEDFPTPSGGKRKPLTEKPDGYPDSVNKQRPTAKQKRKTGTFDFGDVYERALLEAKTEELLKPEPDPPEGTPEVWDPPAPEKDAQASSEKDEQMVPDPPGFESPKEKEANSGQKSQPNAEDTKAKDKDPLSDQQSEQGQGATEEMWKGALTNPEKKITYWPYIIPGPSGGFARKNYKGAKFPVYLYVVTSDLDTFGPHLIEPSIYIVDRANGNDLIEFQLDGEYVMKNATGNEIQILATKHVANLTNSP